MDDAEKARQLSLVRETTMGPAAVVKMTTGPTPQMETTGDGTGVATDALVRNMPKTARGRADMRKGRNHKL